MRHPRSTTIDYLTINGTGQPLGARIGGTLRHGLITRTVYPEVPPRVEYQLTSLTDDLIEPLHLLGVWARTNRPRIVAARQAYDTRTAR